MKSVAFIMALLTTTVCIGQQEVDTTLYRISVEPAVEANALFTQDYQWRGADGAASIDLKNGKIVWLFSDGFICSDSSGARNKSKIIRNSIAIQQGYDLKTATLSFHWNKSKTKPQAFFLRSNKYWFWTGHGTMIKDRLIVFLMKVRDVKKGLGFEIFGWSAALIANPHDEPSKWKINYIDGPDTFGTIAGSAAILTEGDYLYAYGAVEPATHEVYLLRWQIADVYAGNLGSPEWWLNTKWGQRKNKDTILTPLFIGGTEYSVHYDTSLKKYIQIQSFGFGDGKLGMRFSDRLEGPWTEPYMFFTPQYPGVKKPFMYSAKAHPELVGNGLYITYNVNSFDFGELLNNQTIYFPKFILVNIKKR